MTKHQPQQQPGADISYCSSRLRSHSIELAQDGGDVDKIQLLGGRRRLILPTSDGESSHTGWFDGILTTTEHAAEAQEKRGKRLGMERDGGWDAGPERVEDYLGSLSREFVGSFCFKP